jgi:selenium metabolism protein YedF
VPVIKTKKALGEMNAASKELEILVDNEIAVQNISKLLNSLQCSFATKNDGEHFLIQITGYKNSASNSASDASKENSPEEKNSERFPHNTNTTVVISSEFMGTGNDALGKILIKGFVFALTQLENLPRTIIFYNSGVRLVLKNSECLTDLRYLQEHGVKILACGTCLNFFNVVNELAVGEITDMYNIVNLVAQANCVIRP